MFVRLSCEGMNMNDIFEGGSVCGGELGVEDQFELREVEYDFYF